MFRYAVAWLLLLNAPSTAWADIRSDCLLLYRNEAIAACTMVIDGGEKTAWAYGRRGWAHLETNDIDRALADFNAAIELDPKEARVLIGLGSTYVRKGDYERAIAEFNKAIELDPEFVSEAYSSRAGCYGSDVDKAIADYNKAIELNPKNSAAYFGRSIAFQMKGEDLLAEMDHARFLEIMSNP